jgi:glycerophosphoryl diester phosphodiesterase
LDRPENTLPAFDFSIHVENAFQIEMDVWVSSDGELAIIHDSTLDRTTNGTGLVTALTMDELRTLDAGSYFSPEYAGVRIPSMSDVVEWFTTEVPDWELREIDLDVKALNATAVIQGLLALDLPREITSKINVGFYAEFQVKEAYSELHDLGYLIRFRAPNPNLLDDSLEVDSVDLRRSNIPGREWVAHQQSLGRDVIIYTSERGADLEDSTRWAIYEGQIDGVMSDFPGLVLSVVDARAECVMEYDTDYYGQDLATIEGVASAEDCCRTCAEDAACAYWTWGRDNLRCWLKDSGAFANKMPKANRMAGYSRI